MATEGTKGKQSPWETVYGPNLGYFNALYEMYRQNPRSVDDDVKRLFEQWGAPPVALNGKSGTPVDTVGMADDVKVVAAEQLARNIRTYGHLAAKTSPLKYNERTDTRLIDPSAYNLSEADLIAIPAQVVWPEAPENVETALDAINFLRKVYTETISFEFSHVHDVEEQQWLYRMVESRAIYRRLSKEERIALLRRLTEVECFEKFLHRTFVGQKRFSIEGIDMLVPIIDEIVREGMLNGARDIMIGMAHRGRLNVLAHVLGKSYEKIFSEFHLSPNKELVPSEGSMGINYGWTGDVKYHLGANRSLEEDEVRARLTLANNPSHLEFVNPVVEGFARAAQEDRSHAGAPQQDVSRALAILVHGDAAFPGEGIVAETLNMSRLKGYQTGGTIHIIANNGIGFTTESSDARSTTYASDLAKGFEIPVVHVNADDPEACLAAVYLASEYRRRFHKDFLIDLRGYRRFGHNEMDDPEVTQPQLYAEVRRHPTVRALYAEKLQAEGLVGEGHVREMEQTVQQKLRSAYEKLKNHLDEIEELRGIPEKVSTRLPKVKTAVPLDKLRDMNTALLKRPKGFNTYPKLERILKRRATALDDNGKVDWALAETLAFATILADGQAIRLTGQDSERGTFAHRHLVLHDIETGETYSPLQALPHARASFAIHNSPLSEASVLGFEYGYNVFAPETFVIWEAQYGDFANAAQVIIDQFVAAGRAKWAQRSSLVMLLPHGYEGQGPEHSSARMERFLQLSGENNWTIANLTSAAQYFHILRRQAKIAGRDEARPLIIMTPKSLIRNPYTASKGNELSEGRFQFLLEQPGLGRKPDRVERLIFCTGKVGVDLAAAIETDQFDGDALDWLHIVRVEQLYPFPEEELKDVISRYGRVKEMVWVQEEPQNMGAWTYMEPRLRALTDGRVPVRFIGRPERSSPAEGLPDVHNIEQDRIIREAFERHEAGARLADGRKSR